MGGSMEEKKNRPCFETMGSMKHTMAAEEKEFYSCEEAKKFTKGDFDRNPRLFEAVVRSMEAW